MRRWQPQRNSASRLLAGSHPCNQRRKFVGATVPVVDFPIDSWLRVIDVNLTGLFYCCREIVPFMLENAYGRIVNIASVAGKEGNPGASAYSASKAGVIAFTKSLGKELAIKGIMVNCITPATFESPILQQLPQSQIEYMKAKIPMGRLGTVGKTRRWLAGLPVKNVHSRPLQRSIHREDAQPIETGIMRYSHLRMDWVSGKRMSGSCCPWRTNEQPR